MPGWLIAACIGLVGFVLGMLAAAVAMQRRVERPIDVPEADPVPEAIVEDPLDARPLRDAAVSALLGYALREPLRRLRRSEVDEELCAGVEHVAWQARMLASRPRPMKATPNSPEGLLQQAAEQVEAVRLGKVGVSWGILTRRPVNLDADRTIAALSELLAAAADAAGEGGRIGIRIRDSERKGFPVDIEIEIGRRGAELDTLRVTVARHLLTGQGAEFEIDGPTARIHFRS